MYVPSQTPKKRLLIVALRNHIKSASADFIETFITYLHECVCNIFSEILNTPFPDLKIIITSKILQKFKLFKLSSTFFRNFLYCFCIIFEEVQWQWWFFSFGYSSKT